LCPLASTATPFPYTTLFRSVAHTNERTHEIIRRGLDRSPLFTGVIQGVGPRYCPSIEDKVHRFAGRTSHQVFLEPEGLETTEIRSEEHTSELQSRENLVCRL